MIARTALLLPLLATSLFAQTTDKPGVSIRFRALAFDDAIPAASYLEGDTLRRLSIPNNAFTRAINYKGPPTLRFITIDEETLKPRPLTPDMTAAIQRLRRAQAVALQASDEFAQITRLLDTLNFQITESIRKPSTGDQAQIDALNERLKELSAILAAASKETEEANLLILRLESAPQEPPKDAPKKTGRRPNQSPRPPLNTRSRKMVITCCSSLRAAMDTRSWPWTTPRESSLTVLSSSSTSPVRASSYVTLIARSRFVRTRVSS